MQTEWNKEHFIGILWAPIAHRWNDILKDINKDGVEIVSADKYVPMCEPGSSWNQFVIDCYWM